MTLILRVPNFRQPEDHHRFSLSRLAIAAVARCGKKRVPKADILLEKPVTIVRFPRIIASYPIRDAVIESMTFFSKSGE